MMGTAGKTAPQITALAHLSTSGTNSMEEAWVLDIRDQCRRAGVAFFFTQWGGVNKQKTGRLLQGEVYDEMPAARKVG